MSIATQIQRLLNAKSAIKSSIMNKSVTVADTTKLDGYGALINTIGTSSNIGPTDVIKGKMAFGNNGKYFNGTALSVQTSANNARILNGFTAYDSNGQLLTGNAMPAAATAQNNKIMNGYTAYTNTGVLMTGNAFASGTNATNATILKGYTAYTNAGAWLSGSYVPLQVATGTLSEPDENQYIINTSFTPKGFMLIATQYFFDGDYNLLNLYAFNTTTVSGYFEEMYRYVYTSDLLGSVTVTDPPDSTASDNEPTYLSLSPTWNGDTAGSVVDPQMEYAVSYYTETDTAPDMGELGLGHAMADYSAYPVSGCSVTYSSTGATITVNEDYYCPSATYIIWG